MPVDAVTAVARYRFGNFELLPNERLLLEDGAPVTLWPRAFDVLVALVERGGQLVTKEQLRQQVWPHVIVEENTVQAQVSALRKVLGRHAIATVSRHGYRFTLEFEREQEPSAPGVAHNLPQPLTSLIGREKNVAQLDAPAGRDALADAHGCRRLRQDTPRHRGSGRRAGAACGRRLVRRTGFADGSGVSWRRR